MNEVCHPLLRFPHKKIRAQVIKQYMQESGYTKAVCFSCGNAADALIAEGVDTLHIGENGVLTPNKWFSPEEIANIWVGRFDATSGHLIHYLMEKIGKAYKEYLGTLPNIVYVPSGSGETLVCLKMAYPEIDFVAVYGLDKATEYNENAPLNTLVRILARDIYFKGNQWQKASITNG